MSRDRQLPSQLFPPGIPLLPEDFSHRLTALKMMTGLSWQGMAASIGVDSRQLLRWRHGVWPGGGAMLSLVKLATRVPGGLGTLLDEELVVLYGSGE